MSEAKLPPVQHKTFPETWLAERPKMKLFSTDDMHSYAKACMEVERARCRRICEEHAANKSPPDKDHGDTYLNGWRDAANECGWAIDAAGT